SRSRTSPPSSRAGREDERGRGQRPEGHEALAPRPSAAACRRGAVGQSSSTIESPYGPMLQRARSPSIVTLSTHQGRSPCLSTWSASRFVVSIERSEVAPYPESYAIATRRLPSAATGYAHHTSSSDFVRTDRSPSRMPPTAQT